MGANDDLVGAIGKAAGNGAGGAPTPEPRIVRIVLEFNLDTGGLDLKEGPFTNRVMFYGIMDLAKDALLKHSMKSDKARQERPQIYIPGR